MTLFPRPNGVTVYEQTCKTQLVFSCQQEVGYYLPAPVKPQVPNSSSIVGRFASTAHIMYHDSWFVSVLGAREERSGNMRGGMKGREEEDEGENVNDTDARRRIGDFHK